MAHRVVLVAFPGVQSLDVFGPLEALHTATRLGHGDYAIELVRAGAAPVRTGSGIGLEAGGRLSGHRGRIDTLIVAGGDGVADAAADPEIVAAVRAAAGRAHRVASVCTGAFLLAAADVLDDRRATTHWSACAELARRHPRVRVEPDPIYVRDGDVWTSAGVTAGIDLALGLVEADLGAAAARDVARWLVLFLKRPGGQAQFSAALSAPAASRAALREVQAWIPGHLDGDLSVPALAARAHMSPRNFARAFRREVKATPAAYVAAARLEQARAALEDGDEPVAAIARRCGFGTVETMRRAFARGLKVSPAAYRERFRARSAQGGLPHGHRHPAL